MGRIALLKIVPVHRSSPSHFLKFSLTIIMLVPCVLLGEIHFNSRVPSWNLAPTQQSISHFPTLLELTQPLVSFQQLKNSKWRKQKIGKERRRKQFSTSGSYFISNPPWFSPLSTTLFTWHKSVTFVQTRNALSAHGAVMEDTREEWCGYQW